MTINWKIKIRNLEKTSSPKEIEQPVFCSPLLFANRAEKLSYRFQTEVNPQKSKNREKIERKLYF